MPSQDTIPDFPIQDGVRFQRLEQYPGYAIADNGTVWTCRIKGHRNGWRDWRQLKPAKAGYGYWFVVFRVAGSPISRYVHHLVLETFGTRRPDGMECCHNDGNRDNNRIDNLRWDTPGNNTRDKAKHGTQARGQQCPVAKLTDADVAEIRRMYVKGCRMFGQHALAKRYGVDTVTIFFIIHRINWKHSA